MKATFKMVRKMEMEILRIYLKDGNTLVSLKITKCKEKVNINGLMALFLWAHLKIIRKSLGNQFQLMAKPFNNFDISLHFVKIISIFCNYYIVNLTTIE